MKHGLRGQIPMEMIIKIFNYNNNNSNNSNSNSNKRWMPEGLGVVLDPVFGIKFRSFVQAKWLECAQLCQ